MSSPVECREMMPNWLNKQYRLRLSTLHKWLMHYRHHNKINIGTITRY